MTAQKTPDNCLQTLQTEATTLDKCAQGQQKNENIKQHLQTATQCIKELTTACNDNKNKPWLETNSIKVKNVIQKCQEAISAIKEDSTQAKDITKETQEFDTQFKNINNILSKSSSSSFQPKQTKF